MDIDEWEFLSEDTFLDFNEVDEKNYFSSSPNSREIMVHNKNHPVPMPILLQPKTPIDITIASPKLNTEKTKAIEADQETVSQVFFKLKENNEFVEMKMDSPRSNSNRVLFPQMDKGEGMENNIITSPRMKIGKEMINIECDNKEEDSRSWEEEKTSSGFNMLKWSLTGVGAICSFGVAVAAVCVMFFGTSQRNKLQQDQKIRFQICADDKRIKQVLQHATKLNDAVSVVRGVVPMSTPHITIGGYYDGL